MIFAHDKDNSRVHIDDARLRQDYYCPFCGSALTQKKGEIKRHHYAHMPGSACSDTWEREYDMSDWHYEWQSRFPKENQEILLAWGDVKHRADVLIGRTVVEFQHSNMSSKTFNERNNFYHNLGYKVIWVFDMIELFESGKLYWDEDGGTFGWQNPRRTFNTYDIESGQVELFFQIKNDENDCLIKVSEFPCGGFEIFEVSHRFGKTDFMEYVGMRDGLFPLPEHDDISENKEYTDFCRRFNITLNKQQERAVQAVDGANLLLAVPGSGKTTVLVVRLGYMIYCKGIVPESILVMTYTNAAIEDLKERFSSYFGEEYLNRLNIHTINSYAAKIIKRYSQWRNSPSFKLADNTETTTIIRDILKDLLEEYPAESDITDAKSKISYIKNMMLKADTDEYRNIQPLYENYCEKMKNKRLMDYDDQIEYAHTILKNHSHIRTAIQHECQYICVDEAQDTSKLQHAMIRLLVGNNNNIFMVGDEDQSIYGFRGAYPRALINIKNDYKNPFILKMEHNYRSTVEIVEKAALFVERNEGRYPKEIIATREHGEAVQRIDVDNRAAQYNYLLDIAKNATTETAILYRDNEHIIPLADLMLGQGIPFKFVKFSDTFFTSRVVYDAIAFLKLSLDPYDTDSFMKIYFKIGCGIKKDTAKWTCDRARREHITVSKALEKQLAKYSSYRRISDKFSSLMNDITGKETHTVLSCFESIGYGRYMDENFAGRGKYELLKELAKSESDPAKFLLRLEELKKLLKAKNSTADSKIILSTVHSSKGLEYDTVYIMDAFEGVFPSIRLTDIKTTGDKEQYQEDRRLFYVAMTRAKNKLCIVGIKNKRTPFIDEIIPRAIEPQNRIFIDPRRLVGNSYNDTYAVRQSAFQKEMEYRKKMEEEEKRRVEERRIAVEKAAEECLRKGREEVKDKFDGNKEKVFDSYGNRWIKCERCGEIKQLHEFSMYGGENESFGVCTACVRRR